MNIRTPFRRARLSRPELGLIVLYGLAALVLLGSMGAGFALTRGQDLLATGSDLNGLEVASR